MSPQLSKLSQPQPSHRPQYIRHFRLPLSAYSNHKMSNPSTNPTTTSPTTTTQQASTSSTTKPDYTTWPWSRYIHPDRPDNGFRPEQYPGRNTSDTSARLLGTHFPDRTYSTEYSQSRNREPPRDDRPGGWSNTGGGPYRRYQPYDPSMDPRQWK